MERLGESDAFGEVLVEMLEARGWYVYRRAGFGGEGILLVAELDGIRQSAGGPTFASAASTLMQEIATYWPGLCAEEEQLPLFQMATR